MPARPLASPVAAVALLALLAVALAWAGALAVPFQFDDWPTIVHDPATRDAGGLAWRVIHGVRPLLRASFFTDAALWGMRPFGFHLTNLWLHLATCWGIFALARRRLASDGAAILAMLLFALQPANAEVVAYVSGRSTGLATALLVAALFARERAHEAGARSGDGDASPVGVSPRIRWMLAELALFATAVLAKEIALVYPALAFWWEETRPRAAAPVPGGASWSTTVPFAALVPESARAVAPLLAVAAGGGALVAALPRYRELARFSLALRSPLASLAANAQAVPVMLSLWVRPWALTVDHAFVPAPGALPTIAGAALLLAIAAAAFALRRRAPLAALAAGWTLLALAPTNSLIAKSDLVTEKPLYLAWLGPALLLAHLLAPRPSSEQSGTSEMFSFGRRGVAGVLVAAMAVGVVGRVAVWRDPRRLWLEAVRTAPGHARAWNNLGMAFHQAHDDRTAVLALRRAVALDPHDSLARRNLGRLDAARR